MTSPSSRSTTQPLQPTGVLNNLEFAEVTPVIGREYKNVQLTDLLKAANSDELLRELAIISADFFSTVAQRY